MFTGFHLPHNAILPEEVKFILSLIDPKKDFYLYDELKAMMFNEEVRRGVFEKFHSGMYKRILANPDLKKKYEAVKNKTLSYDDIKKLQYTDKKTLNGCWNEQARDYFEFIAFTGLMPSYYKGTAVESEKRYYVGETFKKYHNGELTYQDILFKMKFRNASKNYDNIEQYNVRNRPFVLAIRIMNILKQKGYQKIDGHSLSYMIRNIRNEDDLDFDLVEPVDFTDWSKTKKDEIGRGTTFLKRHLIEGLDIKLVAGSLSDFDLESFDIDKYNFKEKAIFIDDLYDDLEITPLFIRYLKNPLEIKDAEIKNKMMALGLIDETISLYDFNVDTDLADRNLVNKVSETESIETEIYSTKIETTDLYKKGKVISENSDGTAYEEFLYEFMKEKFDEEQVTYLGANMIGQRVSDIVFEPTILNDDGSKLKIRVIIEAKAGKAISSFDERKEKDNIINTLNDKRFGKKYDGIWYIVVDSDKITSGEHHGGFRTNNNQLSFGQKLLSIQSSIMPMTGKLTMVTAFSYHEFMKFVDSIRYDGKLGHISRAQASDFWTWSNRFVKTSYVAIIA